VRPLPWERSPAASGRCVTVPDVNGPHSYSDGLRSGAYRNKMVLQSASHIIGENFGEERMERFSRSSPIQFHDLRTINARAFDLAGFKLSVQKAH
jgi:hypothetical protein